MTLRIHLLEQIFNRPMLATPELMQIAVQFAHTHLGLVINGHPAAPVLGMSDDDGDGPDQEPDDDDPDDTGVAQIGIYGPLVPRTGHLKLCTRMTAYEYVARQLNAAVADPAVTRILLDIDSNGGDARGAFELARQIRAASRIKPVHALVNFSAYSGGYLLASAATDITLSQTGGLGSIGVIMKALDMTRALDSAGVTVHTFARGDRKNDLSPDSPLTDGARTAVDAKLDALYAQFTQAVADYRQLPLQRVIDTQAATYDGQSALDAGLADHLQDPQDAYDRIVGLARQDRASRMATPTASPAPGPIAAAANARRTRLAAAAAAQVALHNPVPHPQ